MAKFNIGKIILLLVLIIILILGGLVWFDYLGVINVKRYFTPIYNLFGLQTQTAPVSSSGSPFVSNLDDDRFAKRLEAIDYRTEELEKREADIVTQEEMNLQIAQELDEQKKSLEEQQKTFNLEREKYDDRRVNIEQQVQYLTGMQPQSAANILLAMDDQNVIDILRRTDEIAAETGASSMVAYWLSLMSGAQGERADRVAQIQRKMLEKPNTPPE
jgi:flagellar protein FlbB